MRESKPQCSCPQEHGSAGCPVHGVCAPPMPTPERNSVPSDAELVAVPGEEQFLLFCDKDERMQIARAVLQRFATAAAVRGAEGEGSACTTDGLYAQCSVCWAVALRRARPAPLADAGQQDYDCPHSAFDGCDCHTPEAIAARARAKRAEQIAVRLEAV